MTKDLDILTGGIIEASVILWMVRVTFVKDAPFVLSTKLIVALAHRLLSQTFWKIVYLTHFESLQSWHAATHVAKSISITV